MRRIYYTLEPTSYSFLLFEAYFEALARAYYSLDDIELGFNIEGLKNILYLMISLIRNFSEDEFIQLENKIAQIKTEKDFIITSFDVFQVLALHHLEIDLFKEVFLSVNTNQTNPRIVELLKAVANNIIYGNDKLTRKALFIFYLTFRHKLKEKIDDDFINEKLKIYELNKKVLTMANKCGLFVNQVPKISGLL